MGSERSPETVGLNRVGLNRVELIDEVARVVEIPKQQADLQLATVGQFQGSIQADQAQIDNANLQITYSHIIAPITGQIGLRLIDEGNIVRAADPKRMWRASIRAVRRIYPKRTAPGV